MRNKLQKHYSLNFKWLYTFRFFPKARKEPLLSFFRVLGFYPHNIEYYLLAVRHKSLSLSGKKGGVINNERLEFLGDAVLNSIVSDTLYRRFEREQEGFLTTVRSNIVKRDSMNEICRRIGLDKLIIADKNLHRQNNNNIYGNALEALIGAVYLDCGYEKCTDFVTNRLLISTGMMESLIEDNENYKSELLEWCQKNRLSLDFELVNESVDRRNNHIFTSVIKIDGKVVCQGNGANKKESHQQAAKRALKIIDENESFIETLK